MKVGRWSTTAGNNNSTPPDGWPEGQAASTVNDCAREMMAALRTVFQDPQFVDQDWTPTYVNATTFTVAGDQTSAIHAGRRVKLFDSSTIYATVATASFTAVTTIQVATDSGTSLTGSLSSFALGVLSNKGMPQGGSLSVAAVAAVNTSKAWVRFKGTATGTLTTSFASFNVASVSRSAAGVYRINFTTPFADAKYAVTFLGQNTTLITTVLDNSTYTAGALAASYKFGLRSHINGDPSAASLYDPTNSIGVSLVFWR
ncbi:MAG TPA: hypothetical protein VF443_06520 [Nitrospira sp.]